MAVVSMGDSVGNDSVAVVSMRGADHVREKRRSTVV